MFEIFRSICLLEVFLCLPIAVALVHVSFAVAIPLQCV